MPWNIWKKKLINHIRSKTKWLCASGFQTMSCFVPGPKMKHIVIYNLQTGVINKEDIIVLDCQLKQLTIHNPQTGVKIKTIEAKDNHGSKVLADPYYVTVTPQNNIVVTDTAAPNIKVFSPEGKYLLTMEGMEQRVTRFFNRTVSAVMTMAIHLWRTIRITAYIYYCLTGSWQSF